MVTVAKRIQLPAIGGLRKSIIPGGNTAVGTTIAEFGSNTVTLAQLANALGVPAAPGSQTGTIAPGGGAGTPASITVGPGLQGGGVLLGAVQLHMTAPIGAHLLNEGGGNGEDGSPGANGVAGATGAQGPQGIPIFLAADNGIDGMDAIPGPQGIQGATGAQGATGPAVFFLAEDGIPGDFIPGPPGPPASSTSGGLPPVTAPTQIPGLLYWFDASILANSFPTGAGNGISILGSPDPYRLPGSAFVAGSGNGAFLDTSTLNGLSVLNFPGSAAGQYTLGAPQMTTPAQTIFVVFKLATFLGQATFNICGGPTNSIALGVGGTSNPGKLQLQITNTTAIANSTATLATGTWYQVNTAYDGANYSYRIARAADVSGASAHTATQPQTGFGWNGSTPNLPWNGLIAEFIYYNRVLTLAQIQAVEAYLFNKWNV